MSQVDDYKVTYDTHVVPLGDATFLYLPDDDGGRLIRTDQIKSIVPDFKHGGSMVFLASTEKAVRISQSPEDIVDSALR